MEPTASKPIRWGKPQMATLKDLFETNVADPQRQDNVDIDRIWNDEPMDFVLRLVLNDKCRGQIGSLDIRERFVWCAP
jgi:hypothetical protein